MKTFGPHGELGEKIKEQSLVINAKKGNIILTGCAHPGLNNIMEKSREFGEVYAVIGGFHDSNINMLNKIPMLYHAIVQKNLKKLKKRCQNPSRIAMQDLLLD